MREEGGRESAEAYYDIIDLPRHVSSRHPQMPLMDRAAQFAPFAALTGYEEAVRETARLTEEFVELDEDQKEQMDRRLRWLCFLEEEGRLWADGRCPGSENCRPGSENCRPEPEDCRPGSEHCRPGSENSRPRSEHSRPRSENCCPGSENSRPGPEHSRPGSEHRRPESGEHPRERDGQEPGGPLRNREVEVTYFRPDLKKSGGAYVTVRGLVKKIDRYHGRMQFMDGTVLPLERIVSIEGELFQEMEDSDV